MTDARFLTNNSVTGEANHVKCKTLCRVVGRIKALNCNCRIVQLWKSAKGFASAGRLFPKKYKCLLFWGPRSKLRAPIGVKFCSAKRTQVPLGCAKCHTKRCNESPLRGENADFWRVSKFNAGTLSLRGFLPVTKKTYKHHIFAPTAGARYLISPNFAWW